jgi:hypothetical protein
VTSQYLCTFLFFWKGWVPFFGKVVHVQAFTKQNMSSNHPSLKQKNMKLLKGVDEVSGLWVAEAGCAPPKIRAGCSLATGFCARLVQKSPQPQGG